MSVHRRLSRGMGIDIDMDLGLSWHVTLQPSCPASPRPGGMLFLGRELRKTTLPKAPFCRLFLFLTAKCWEIYSPQCVLEMDLLLRTTHCKDIRQGQHWVWMLQVEGQIRPGVEDQVSLSCWPGSTEFKKVQNAIFISKACTSKAISPQERSSELSYPQRQPWFHMTPLY